MKNENIVTDRRSRLSRFCKDGRRLRQIRVLSPVLALTRERVSVFLGPHSRFLETRTPVFLLNNYIAEMIQDSSCFVFGDERKNQ